VVLIIRQNLDDDSQEAMIGEHGSGMIHLAQRPRRGAMMTDMQYRFGGILEGVLAKRIGIEKRGDSITIFVSLKGERRPAISGKDECQGSNQDSLLPYAR
jgi:hypothetical protein